MTRVGSACMLLGGGRAWHSLVFSHGFVFSSVHGRIEKSMAPQLQFLCSCVSSSIADCYFIANFLPFPPSNSKMATFRKIPPPFSPSPLHLPIKSLQAQKPAVLSLNHPICIKCSTIRPLHITYQSRSRPRFVPLAVDGGEAAKAEEPEVTDIQEGTLDTKLPRRSLLVHFTCDACGERTERTINRLAYERGTVFVQCAGCLQHHKLVDNLGLVVEYDFREERTSNTDSV